MTTFVSFFQAIGIAQPLAAAQELVTCTHASLSTMCCCDAIMMVYWQIKEQLKENKKLAADIAQYASLQATMVSRTCSATLRIPACRTLLLQQIPFAAARNFRPSAATTHLQCHHWR